MDKKIHNTQNWISLGKLWKQYHSVIDTCLKDFSTNAKSPSYNSITYQNLLQRIYFGVRTSEILLSLIKQSYFKFSIAIQLRSTILDSMISVYLIDFANDELNFKKQIANLSHQTARNINIEIEEKCKTQTITAEQRKKLFEDLDQIFPGNFNLNGKNVFNSNHENLTASAIVAAYCKSSASNSDQQKWMLECYELYKYFSIYEHFNVLSKTLLEHELAFDYDLNKFIYSSKFIFDSTIVCLTAMKDNGNYIKQIEELKTEWNNITPTSFKNEK